MEERDERLIGYLARNNHWTPFGHQRFSYTVSLRGDEFVNLAEWATTDEATGFVMERVYQEGPDEWLCRITFSLWGWFRGRCPLDIIPSIHADILRRCPVSAAALMNDQQAIAASAATREVNDQDLDGIDIGPRHLHATFRITAPIFVFRQLMRSNAGIVYNEVSRRYVDDAPQLWSPQAWRGRPDGSIKQGSGEPIDYEPSYYRRHQIGGGESASVSQGDAIMVREYERRLAAGVAPELARTCLPQSMISSLWMTATYPALERIIGLRLHSHAQQEIRELAEELVAELPAEYHLIEV